MKVLILEDTGEMFNQLVDNFNDIVEVKDVIGAFQVSEAMDKFEEEKPNFLIIDLYVPPSGLTKAETDKSQGGRLSGWLWLKNYIFKENVEWKSKVIIYSDYINNVLKKNVTHEELEGIKLMPKGQYKLKEVVEEFTKMIKK